MLLLLSCPALVSGKTLKITSTPPGATVELDDKVVGVTPYEQDFPFGYFQRPMTSIQKRLEHPVRVRLALVGYVTQEVVLTIGPKDWLDLHRRSHGYYWLFKSDQFHIDLPPLPPSTQGVSSAGIFLPRAEDARAPALPFALTLASRRSLADLTPRKMMIVSARMDGNFEGIQLRENGSCFGRNSTFSF